MQNYVFFLLVWIMLSSCTKPKFQWIFVKFRSTIHKFFHNRIEWTTKIVQVIYTTLIALYFLTFYLVLSGNSWSLKRAARSCTANEWRDC